MFKSHSHHIPSSFPLPTFPLILHAHYIFLYWRYVFFVQYYHWYSSYSYSVISSCFSWSYIYYSLHSQLSPINHFFLFRLSTSRLNYLLFLFLFQVSTYLSDYAHLFPCTELRPRRPRKRRRRSKKRQEKKWNFLAFSSKFLVILAPYIPFHEILMVYEDNHV